MLRAVSIRGVQGGHVLWAGKGRGDGWHGPCEDRTPLRAAGEGDLTIMQSGERPGEVEAEPQPLLLMLLSVDLFKPSERVWPVGLWNPHPLVLHPHAWAPVLGVHPHPYLAAFAG